MDIKFMHSKSFKTFDSHRLILNLIDKVIAVALLNLSIYSKWNNIKESYRKNKLEYQLERIIKNLRNLIDHNLYKTFKIILRILSKTNYTLLDYMKQNWK